MRQNRAVALDLDRDLHPITRTVAYYAKVEKLRGTSQQKVKTNQIQLRTFSIPLLLTTGYLVPLFLPAGWLRLLVLLAYN